MLPLSVQPGKNVEVGSQGNGSSVAVDLVDQETGGGDSIEECARIGAGLDEAPWPEFSDDHRSRLRRQKLDHAREGRRFRTLRIDLDDICSRYAALEGQRIQSHGLYGYLASAASRIVQAVIRRVVAAKIE